MFNDIGSKVKGLAKLVCILGIISSLIWAIVIWASGVNGSGLTGFITLVIGCLASWIGSWTTYAIGEAADQKSDIESLKKSVVELKALISNNNLHESDSMNMAATAANVHAIDANVSDPTHPAADAIKAPVKISTPDFDIKTSDFAANLKAALENCGGDSVALKSFLMQLSSQYLQEGKKDISGRVNRIMKASDPVSAVNEYIKYLDSRSEDQTGAEV